ncbi:hypothetical protein Ddye_000759 [Dipteronia dyeriana]|uniref:HhH-GPD domain-containing protein n=1 Tax=Dipteronia dyeriana TaxID=168575 RepID=A0AAE0CSP0_9ROSI|nr:hypothetical protein Ddye_000759 [Dipteronia dyeriana]
MAMEDECLLKLLLPNSSWKLEKAVCSHGLFMMSPNHWDPLSRSFSRPLHLSLDDNGHAPPSSSVMVRIFHPQETPNALHVKVYNTGSVSLSSKEQETLLGQVARMLRLSDSDERNAREFERIVSQESEESDYMKNFGGRVFRSPTLFEDMVKCILLCNCQWPRTLSMARALCELQWELQHCSSSISVAEKIEMENFIPNTPVGKESKRKVKMSKVATRLTSKIARIEVGLEEDLKLDNVGGTKEHVNLCSFQNNIEDDLHTLNELSVARLCLASEGREPYACDRRIGNFPSPRELANLDESFLAKRCGLGYRAVRILKLAQAIVEGRIQLNQLEEVCNEASFTSYDKLAEQLSKIDGFGPFTCANVLVCMGFYHVIPSDSETIRHLKQVHAKKSTVKTVQMDVEAIYRKYAPYQFLAYWSELWHFYEQRFGKLSELPYADYKLITASNMRIKRSCKVKKSKKC